MIAPLEVPDPLVDGLKQSSSFLWIESPMPHGMSTLHGQSVTPISSEGMMLTTIPPAASARSAATRVAGLPQPLTTVIPRRASSSPAAPASS